MHVCCTLFRYFLFVSCNYKLPKVSNSGVYKRSCLCIHEKLQRSTEFNVIKNHLKYNLKLFYCVTHPNNNWVSVALKFIKLNNRKIYPIFNLSTSMLHVGR